MSTKYTIIASIFSVVAATSFSLKFNHYGILFAVLAVVFFFCALMSYRKELKEKKDSQPTGGFQIESYVTDEDTALVIKSIKYSDNGFINFGDIVNETNLSLRIINIALDWLVINKLATESKSRRGKAYELTPKGRDVFKSI
jgi:predicted transcriptional regulator